MPHTPPLTIGRLAKAAKINVETIRHYQQVGLIIGFDKYFKGTSINSGRGRLNPKSVTSRRELRVISGLLAKFATPM